VRVGVALRYLRPGRVGGSEVYCHSLVAALRELDVELVLFCSAEAADGFAAGPNVTVVPARRPYSAGGRLAAENLGLARHVRRHGLDLLFFPANFGAPLLPSRVPQVVTVHDLQHQWLPQHLPRRVRWERSLLFGATFARRSTRVIAISDFTRADLLHRWRLAPERVTTVLEGVPEEVPANPERQLRTSRELGLHRPFVFYPAADHAHKNHLGLVRALARLHECHGPELDLVLTGSRGSVWAEAEAEAARLGIAEHVRHLGFVERGQLFDLFHLASVMAFPSEFEGFGLPLLEAQRCGLPVVASTAASIPEVSGGAAVLVGPHDVEGWAAALHRAHGDVELRADLIARGHANVDRFSWEQCARETLAVFEDALRG